MSETTRTDAAARLVLAQRVVLAESVDRLREALRRGGGRLVLPDLVDGIAILALVARGEAHMECVLVADAAREAGE